ncbi:MAG TPA: YcxB family protein [Armatimonadaceae bacterium]|nr:YcxB family protein [Armatimonadaceae bacterium]
MTVAYDHTEEDTRDWYRYYLTRTPEGRRALRWSRLGGAALFGALVFLMAWALAQPERGEWGYIVTAALAAAVVRYTWQVASFSADAADWARRWARSSTARRAAAAGRISLSATAEGLRFVWSEGESLLRWASVRNVTRTDEHVVIYWSDDEVTLIPHRAFADGAHMDAFATRMEKYRSASLLAAPVDSEALATAPQFIAPAATGGTWYRDRQTVDTDEVTRTRLTR